MCIYLKREMDFKDIVQLQKKKKSKLEFQKGWFKSLLKEREKSPSSSINSQCCRCRYRKYTGGRHSLKNIRVGEQVPEVRFFQCSISRALHQQVAGLHWQSWWQWVCIWRGFGDMVTAVYLCIDSSCRHKWLERVIAMILTKVKQNENSNKDQCSSVLFC